MCIRLVERYSVCGCLYYKHPIDLCAAASPPPHRVQEKTIPVGYICTNHSRSWNSGHGSHARVFGSQNDSGYGSSRSREKTSKKPPRSSVELEHSCSSNEATTENPKLNSIVTDLFPQKSGSHPEHPVLGLQEAGQRNLGLGLPGLPAKPTDGPDTTGLYLNYSDTDAFEGNHDHDSDNDSNNIAQDKSWFECEDSSESVTTAPDVDMASAELFSLLLEHHRLRDLYPTAVTTLGSLNFRKSMHRVLKAYAEELRVGATQPQELQSSFLVRSLSRRVAHALVAFYDPSVPSTDVDFRWKNLQRQKMGAIAWVEHYLSGEPRQMYDQEQRPDREQREVSEDHPDDVSDDSDREGLDNSLPNLSKVKAYLTEGPAFENFCMEVQRLSDSTSKNEGLELSNLKESKATEKTASESCNEQKSVRAEVQNLSSGFSEPEASLLLQDRLLNTLIRKYQAHKSWLKSNFWPKPSSKTTRLQWTCDCGVILYEDYATTDPSVVEKLSALLVAPHPTTIESPATPNRQTVQASSITSASTESRSSSASSNTDNTSDEGESFCSGCSNQRCTYCTAGMSKKFLALCINTGRFHHTLGEIDVTNICRDNEAFKLIKARYLEIRGFRARACRLFLFQPTSVHFVKLNVEDAFRADIVERSSIPPKAEVLARCYDYSPLDLPLPPMTSNSFLHYLENPACESLARTRRWLGCLPKRLAERLEARRRCCEADIVVTGWRVHIQEGPNEEVVAGLALVVLLCSGLVGCAYSARAGDVSGGFTVAAYIATVLGVGISMLAFRWRRE